MTLEPDDLVGRHDPHLPDWGPYTKKYIGISHCADMERGLRFDLSVFPGLYRRATRLPNVRTESGYHPWEVSANLEYIKHRHEVLWKDKLYCDVAFSQVAKNARLIEMQLVNNGAADENMVMHYMASLSLPAASVVGKVEFDDDCRVVRGLDYSSFEYMEDNFRRHLQWDGHRRAEAVSRGALGGFALAVGGGEKALIRWDDVAGCVRMRCRCGGRGVIRDESGETLVEVVASDEWQVVRLGCFEGGVTVSIECDELFLVDAVVAGEGMVVFSEDKMSTAPVVESLGGNKAVISYSGLEHCYGIAWPADVDAQIRTFATDTLDELFRETIHDHVRSGFVQGDNPDGNYVNCFMRPLSMRAKSDQTLYGFVCCGSREEVGRLLDEFDGALGGYIDMARECRECCYNPKVLSGGQKYLESQQRMAATALSNVVFPIRTRGQYIRHYTPGRWWDCLYTWDSGCIGVGQIELDINRAIDNLNAYVTEPGDDESAFIHHGSPVPTQFMVFHSIWNRTCDRGLLSYFYPRMKQYHDFLMGRIGGSNTRDMKSGLLRTWDYFYNSGGWDDYPPQQHVHEKKLSASVTPVVNSAFAIRTAKMLLQAAGELGEDGSEYEKDINELSSALQDYCWDGEAGYFSYLMHDDTGVPQKALRHESGENFNCGLDGVTPLIADICTAEQVDVLLGKLMDEKHLWSSAGLSTVDQSAAYYRRDGYWNGAVWIPHQWFIWKALLDLGRIDEARKIARTALELWAAEVGESYNCFEHFIVETSRGAGWHHFSGLSTPVLGWFASYYVPGTLTTGFNGWLNSCSFSENLDRLEAEISFCSSSHSPAAIVTMAPEKDYEVLVNGQAHDYSCEEPGRLEIVFPAGQQKVTLQIS